MFRFQRIEAQQKLFDFKYLVIIFHFMSLLAEQGLSYDFDLNLQANTDQMALVALYLYMSHPTYLVPTLLCSPNTQNSRSF